MSRVWVGFVGLIAITVICWLAGQPRGMSWRVIDLTHTLHPDIPTWPGSPSFELRNLAKHAQGYYINSFSCSEHTGTHVDAPIHFSEASRSMHEVPITQLVGEACVIDITRKVTRNNDYRLSVSDILGYENLYGQIPSGSFVIARTGWEERWFNPKSYVNADENKVMHFPGFSEEAAKLLLERNIAGVGIDTLSIDYGKSEDFIVHKVLLSANKIAVENLAHLKELPFRGATIIVGALKVRDGSGAPARVLALVRQ